VLRTHQQGLAKSISRVTGTRVQEVLQRERGGRVAGCHTAAIHTHQSIAVTMTVRWSDWAKQCAPGMHLHGYMIMRVVNAWPAVGLVVTVLLDQRQHLLACGERIVFVRVVHGSAARVQQ
jgi:hypothetical protein